MDRRVRPTVAADLPLVASAMRAEDVAEIAAGSGDTPLQSLEEGLRVSSSCWTFVPEDTPAAIFGVAPHPLWPDRVCAGWLLGTDEIVKHRMVFLAGSRACLEEAGRGYDLMANFVDARNTVHIRWLKWCGFSFLARHESYGVEGRPFLEFARLLNV